MQSTVISVSARMFVCLSARISRKPHVQISSNFLYVLQVAVAWSSSMRIKYDAHISSSSPGGGTGDAVCHLRLHLVPENEPLGISGTRASGAEAAEPIEMLLWG